MQQPNHKHGFRSVYTLTVHIVLVTKYRRKVITEVILLKLAAIFQQTCQKWECNLKEFNGESDHVHLVVDFKPEVQLSKLIANLKTVSSRLIRKEFSEYLDQVYSKPMFWSGSYFVSTCAGLTVETLKRYVQNQDSPHTDKPLPRFPTR
jgi:putative transposase